MRAPLLLVALAACDRYAHRSTFHAPGRAIELDKPLPLENGDPKRYQGSLEPGTETLTVVVAPYVIGGLGRDAAGGEFGTELRFEHHEDEGDGYVGKSAIAITAGMGFFQWYDHRPIAAPAAFYGELSYRGLLNDTVPMDIGIGPAIYSGEPNVGGQLTIRSMLCSLRVRYMAATGPEVMFGYILPIPFFFQRSR